MHPRHLFPILAATAAIMALPASGQAHQGPPAQPGLAGRALLPADASSPAPFPGIPNTDPAPAPGSTQPVGGFSALLDAPGEDEYFAMPDNGFGNKANSRSFLLRLYEVHAGWETAHGGSGSVRIDDVITLRDPDHRIPFALVNGATPERLLTGGDFDIESVRIDRAGTLWFGDEFGPFLVHADATGKVLEAPIPLPDVKSPDYPAGYPEPIRGAANLASSNGFEGMALSQDGRKLYPALEGPVAGDDPSTRRIYEFDLRSHSYTSTRRTYRIGGPGAPASLFLSDLSALDERHLVSLERDNDQGMAARWKRGFAIDLRDTNADGTLAKRQVVDLLALRDPAGISLPGRPGDIGLGDPFSMPYVTIEAVLPIGGDRLAIVNDTNFGSTGRNPSLPDYSDFIQVRVPGLRGDVG
jgi:glycerophosphoryl diester phosphodiesterase